MTPILSVRGVTRAFGGLKALTDVSFDVATEEILGVIGPNGAGKSTLFNAICGYLRPQAGEVSIDGADIVGYAPQEIARRGIVKTFQTSRPFGSMSFLENVVVGALSRRLTLSRAFEQARRCLAEVGLSDFCDAPARGASTGQRKRLEIARALASEPRLLLLDEPLGGVDFAAIEGMIDLLHRVRRNGVTIMVIEHNLDAVQRLVDRLIAMNLGRKIAEGAPQDVTHHPQVVSAYLGTDETSDA